MLSENTLIILIVTVAVCVVLSIFGVPEILCNLLGYQEGFVLPVLSDINPGMTTLGVSYKSGTGTTHTFIDKQANYKNCSDICANTPKCNYVSFPKNITPATCYLYSDPPTLSTADEGITFRKLGTTTPGPLTGLIPPPPPPKDTSPPITSPPITSPPITSPPITSPPPTSPPPTSPTPPTPPTTTYTTYGNFVTGMDRVGKKSGVSLEECKNLCSNKDNCYLMHHKKPSGNRVNCLLYQNEKATNTKNGYTSYRKVTNP